jgi:hypothetical protein
MIFHVALLGIKAVDWLNDKNMEGEKPKTWE